MGNKGAKMSEKYKPTHKEFEIEYIRDLSSDRHCEHVCSKDEYMKLYRYTSWLEEKYSKRVDMTKKKGYRF